MFQTYTRRRRQPYGSAPAARVELYPVPPDDIIEDIFARLPAKAVYRCRCLSRAWAARLGSDDFTDRHFRLANDHGGPRILFLQACISGDGGAKVHRWSPDNPDGTNLMEAIASQSGMKQHNIPCLVTQPCRGLVILKARGHSQTHYVLNPSTGRMTALPKSRAMACAAPTRLGLGYDTVTKKHKVVCIYYNNNGEKPRGFNGCDVYVINSTTKDWRPVEGCGEKHSGWVNENQESVFTQRHVHWLAKRSVGPPMFEEAFVLSFSLDDETFVSMPLPQLEMRGHRYILCLTELKGRLCLFCTEMHNGDVRARTVWLLRGHDTCMWDLHCRIDLDTLPPKVARFMRSEYWVSLLGAADGGRRLILVRPCFASLPASILLCSYDPVTNDMENLIDASSLVSNGDMVLIRAALYEESIASPG